MLRRIAILVCTALLVTGCGLFGAGDAPAGSTTGSATPSEGGAPQATPEPPAEDDPGDAPDDNPVDEPSSADIPEELFDLFNPTDALDLIGKFEVLAYRWENTGEDGSALEVRFEWLGQEDVDGVMTERASLHFIDELDPEASDALEMWLDAEGKAVKARFSDGEDVPGMVVDMLSQGLIAVTMMPFQQFNTFFLRPLRNGDLAIVSHESTRTTLAGIDATVHTYVMRGTVPGHTDVNDVKFETASFAGFDLMLRAEIIGAGEGFELTPLELKLR